MTTTTETIFGTIDLAKNVQDMHKHLSTFSENQIAILISQEVNALNDAEKILRKGTDEQKQAEMNKIIGTLNLFGDIHTAPTSHDSHYRALLSVAWTLLKLQEELGIANDNADKFAIADFHIALTALTARFRITHSDQLAAIQSVVSGALLVKMINTDSVLSDSDAGRLALPFVNAVNAR